MRDLDQVEVKRLLCETTERDRKRRRGAKTLISAVPIENAFIDGIWEVEPALFSQTIAFTDISYQNTPADAREAILTEYSRFLNAFSQEYAFELTLLNRRARDVGDGNEFFSVADPILAPHAKEMNKILNDQLTEGVANIVRERYMTISTGAEDYSEARRRLTGRVSDAKGMLSSVQSSADVLDGIGRLRLIQEIVRPGTGFTFDYDDYLYAGGPSPKEAVLPAQVDFCPSSDGNYFKNMEDGKYFCALAFNSASYGKLEDACLAEIVGLDIPLCVSVHLQPISLEKSLQDLGRKRAFIDNQVVSEQQKAQRNGYSQAIISDNARHFKMAADEADRVLRHSEEEQHEFLTSGVVLVWAESEAGLKSACEQVTRASGHYGIKLVGLDHMQLEGLVSALPLGVSNVPYARRFFTHQAALFAPFATEEIWDEGGAYVGQNYHSKNLTFIARWRLPSPGGFVLGSPGSGKSFCMKQDITNIALITQRDAEARARKELGGRARKADIIEYANAYPTAELIIIDVKKSEYSPLIEAFADHAEEVVIAPGVSETRSQGGVFINPLDLPVWMQLAAQQNPVSSQVELMLALFGEARGDAAEITASEKTIIDRCVREIYAGFADITKMRPEDTTPDKMPTFVDLYESLSRQKSDDAMRLAEFLELYTSGSFNSFSQKSTFEFTKRITSFNVSRLGDQMRTFTMLVLLNLIMNRMYYNNQRGVRTFVWIDEVQALFTSDYVVTYFERFWSEGRAWGLVPTGMSQNFERVLNHEKARYMIKNSGYLELFAQADDERKALVKLLELPPTLEKNIKKGVAPGRGLVRAGAMTVPIEGNIPKTSPLFELWDTKPEEALEKTRQKFMEAQAAKPSPKTRTRRKRGQGE